MKYLFLIFLFTSCLKVEVGTEKAPKYTPKYHEVCHDIQVLPSHPFEKACILQFEEVILCYLKYDDYNSETVFKIPCEDYKRSLKNAEILR